MNDVDLVYLLARILTCGIWVAAGAFKATHIGPTVAEMKGHGIPLAHPVLFLVIALEIVGSLALIFDVYVWLVCVAWLVFMVPASYLYHFRFMVRNGTIDFVQWVLFWKNVSIAGGLFALILLDASRPAWLFTG